MPYGNDPANSPEDELRFYLGDTTEPYELTDEEVAFLLADAGGNARRAAARGAEILGSKFAQLADEKQVGPLRLKYSEKSGRFATLATTLWGYVSSGNVIPFAGGISRMDKASREADTDLVEPAFGRRMQEYPGGSYPSNNRSERLGRY